MSGQPWPFCLSPPPPPLQPTLPLPLQANMSIDTLVVIRPVPGFRNAGRRLRTQGGRWAVRRGLTAVCFPSAPRRQSRPPGARGGSQRASPALAQMAAGHGLGAVAALRPPAPLTGRRPAMRTDGPPRRPRPAETSSTRASDRWRTSWLKPARSVRTSPPRWLGCCPLPRSAGLALRPSTRCARRSFPARWPASRRSAS